MIPEEGDEGSIAVEFAAVAMLLFTLLFGIIAFSLHLGARSAAAQAAAEGARASVAGLTDTDRAALALAAANATIANYNGAFRASGTPTARRVGNRFEVTVKLDISQFNLSRLTAFVPALSDYPQATVSVQIGGFGG
jgi:Flp pilus assembly protein TadG